MSKPNSAAATAKKQGSSFDFGSMLPYIVIVVGFILCYFIWDKVLGADSNFEGNNRVTGHPLGYMGTVYKGGVLVPVLMTVALTTLVFIFERLFTVIKARGKGSNSDFLRSVQANLQSGNIQSAISACDKQKGSVANVVRAGLVKYAEMEKDTTLDKDTKIAAIQKEMEETTGLELPMLEKNLVILATIASVATLTGLLGTVFGMIKSFQAMATAGAPDAVALSTGISEALINTALGIGTSAFAIIFYNVFTTQIDKLTYFIDEAGVSIAQTFAAKHNN
jgi:biopolymer transport protein ExbB